jgi:hypothetical protein
MGFEFVNWMFSMDFFSIINLWKFIIIFLFELCVDILGVLSRVWMIDFVVSELEI